MCKGCAKSRFHHFRKCLDGCHLRHPLLEAFGCFREGLEDFWVPLGVPWVDAWPSWDVLRSSFDFLGGIIATTLHTNGTLGATKGSQGSLFIDFRATFDDLNCLSLISVPLLMISSDFVIDVRRYSWAVPLGAHGVRRNHGLFQLAVLTPRSVCFVAFFFSTSGKTVRSRSCTGLKRNLAPERIEAA